MRMVLAWILPMRLSTSAPEMPHNEFGEAARTAAGNVGQAPKYTVQDMAEGQIAPRFQGDLLGRRQPAAG